MCLKDVRRLLAENDIQATISQIRWAIESGHVSRPPLDGSLRFDFGPQHVEQLIAHFKADQHVDVK
jgi:hypothetical protein